jgi:hypothetical protein
MLGRSGYTYIGELYQFKTADNVTLNLSGHVWMQDFGGFGLANFDYQTRVGYKQTGSTEIDFRGTDRSFNVNIYRRGIANRADYWTERKRLIDIFRPNRGGLLTMTIITETGVKRSIKCRLSGGLEFTGESGNENNWDFNLTLAVIAFDPTWYNTDETLFTPTATSDEQLVFPVTFDGINQITFGTSGQVFTTSVLVYEGNWRSYPLMTIDGPYQSVTITNTANDAIIQLLSSIATGQQRIINTEPGNIYVIDENGDSAINELSKNSNFVDFAILPESEYPDGITSQEISANLVGAVVGQSGFTVQYNERFIGI